ncbi:tryptophan 7-halogenase [Sphingomonas sp.]|uniref:tryptophan 7-halogenase n=1 Tax=Sphingomonas sp. TaxID=28214 RepID=UPI002ED9A583
MKAPVERVAVYGGGIAAPMAALAIARAFGRLGAQVTWIDTGEAPPPHAALVGLPDLASFHRLLSIQDATLIGDASATLNMGQQFAGWSGGEGAFLHAYGDAGTVFASLPFVQHWTRARQAGLRVALEDFSLAAAAAKEGRIGEARDPATRQAVKHGWHLDAAGYAALLRGACRSTGVTILSGTGAHPHAGDGRIDRIELAGGENIGADLFVDADGELITRLDPQGGMAGAAGCDRLIRGSAAPLEPVPPYSRVTAHPAGWATLIPLGSRLAVELAYDSRYLSDGDARAMLGQLAGRPVEAGETEAVSAMVRSRPWVANCVAIGRAAGAAPLLDGAELLLLQLAVAQLVLLWPVDRDAMPEADIYNDELSGSRARVGDFTAQHFRLNARSGEPFWDAARTVTVSAELAGKIDLFAARGMFAHFNHEAHVEDGWALCMAGHGVVPRSFDPQASLVQDQALMAEFQRQLHAIAVEVRGMETHAQALARIRSSGR